MSNARPAVDSPGCTLNSHSPGRIVTRRSLDGTGTSGSLCWPAPRWPSPSPWSSARNASNWPCTGTRSPCSKAPRLTYRPRPGRLSTLGRRVWALLGSNPERRPFPEADRAGLARPCGFFPGAARSIPAPPLQSRAQAPNPRRRRNPPPGPPGGLPPAKPPIATPRAACRVVPRDRNPPGRRGVKERGGLTDRASVERIGTVEARAWGAIGSISRSA